MRDITYCCRKECPNLNCAYHMICAPQGAAWWADRWDKDLCPEFEEAVIMEEKKLEPWQERFVTEYKELAERRKKLGAMLEKWNLGQLDFTPKCPYDLLWKQFLIMGDYESVLLERAKIEGIEL